jgi:hypothetical protein
MMNTKKVKMTMINHMMTDKYGSEWSSYYSLDEFIDYLYKVDDQVLVGSEHTDWGYTEGGKPYN